MPIFTEAGLRPKRQRLWMLPVVLGMLVVLAGSGVALALHRDPREAQALQTEGALVGVTYGNEPLLLGANWQK